MPIARNGEHEINYDAFGSPDDPALVLVNGYRSQMINYEPAFCELLASRGFHVIRFDNRDVGLSGKTPGDRPSFEMKDGRFVLTGVVPYTVADMAADGMAVLDDLGIERAHVFGMSMGGMIVQVMAINHPDRVLSMTSVMSTTGDPNLRGEAKPEALAALASVPREDREGYIEDSVKTRRIISGPHFDEEQARRKAAENYDRCFHPEGAAFQMAAVLSDGDRTDRLVNVACPTLVIHGRVDPLVPLAGGVATAEAVPGAELLILDEMGHDLPEPLWGQIADAVAANAARATVTS